jgi:acyl-[acyl-carrier-protein]-phospholipid O-acyltransferase / long-chain-fatty-acid--[acyl-carrier-protein] ligase
MITAAKSPRSSAKMDDVIDSCTQMGAMADTATGATGKPGKVAISSPRFHAFLTAQFLGALNDNAFKMTLVLFMLSVVTGEAGEVRYTSLATAVYPVPFLLFSPLAGYFADRFPKHRVLFWTKCPEIIAMTLATIGLYLGSVPFLLFVLFFTATHSAFFSPAKYGILPEVFEDAELSSANGVLEMTTDLAILIGSISGVYIYRAFSHDLAQAGIVFIAIACLGTIAIIFAPRAPAGSSSARFVWNVFGSFRNDLNEVSRIPALYYTVIGIGWFGFLGSFFLAVIPVFGKNALGLDEAAAGTMLAVLSVGVGIGAVVAGRLSRNHIELGLVPLGSAGVMIGAVMLARSGGGRFVPAVGIPLNVIVDLALMGLASGFFIIPLNAMLQQRAPEGMKGRLVAFSNVLTFAAVLAAAGLPWMLTGILGFTTREAILLVAGLTFAGTVYVVRMLPDFLVRLVVFIITNTVYRIRVVGGENLPKEGALLVANHVSWVDGLLVAGATDRMVRFLMFRPYYEWKWVNWFFRMMHAIPVAASDSPEKVAQSLAIARAEIQQGHVACIFAEGSISRTGNLLRFRRGLERIAAGVNCPIVPVYLDGVWGSIFSFDRGRFLFKRPKRIFEPVTVFVGASMASDATADHVRQAIQDLSVEAFRYRKAAQRPLHIAFARRAKKRWFGILAVDADGSRIRFGSALAGTIALSHRFFGGRGCVGEHIGVLMPSGIDALLANFAIWFAGGVPVNLDLNESATAACHIVKSASIRRIITRPELAANSAFAGACANLRILDIGEASASISPARMLMLKTALCLMPTAMIARIFAKSDARGVDQLATILYSYPSDTPDRPRGAMLTHHNLLSNLESLRQVFRVTREDSVLCLLPFANSIGFSATLILPALTGARAVYAVALLDSDKLGWI